MEMPEAFRQALERKEEIVLSISIHPFLCDSRLEPLWELNGFNIRAAFFLADNLLEKKGYQPALDGELRWTHLDP